MEANGIIFYNFELYHEWSMAGFPRTLRYTQKAAKLEDPL